MVKALLLLTVAGVGAVSALASLLIAFAYRHSTGPSPGPASIPTPAPTAPPIPLTPLPYNEQLAFVGAVLSSAAYEKDMCQNWTFPNPVCTDILPGYTTIDTFGNEMDPGGGLVHAYAFVGVQEGGDWGPGSDGAVVVGFKGTSDYADWVADLTTWLRFNRDCKLGVPGNGTTTTSSSSSSTTPSSRTPPTTTITTTTTKRKRRGAEAAGEEEENEEEEEEEEEGVWNGLQEDEREGGAEWWWDVRQVEQQQQQEEEWEEGEWGEEINLGRVHHGFCDYYKDLADLGLAETVAKLANDHPTYRVLFTGHSLGGAAATLGAADLGVRFGIASERIMLYTYGGPRVGDLDFSLLLEEKVGSLYRVIHRRDVVPHLPPCCHSWLGHCTESSTCPLQPPEEVFYDNDMKAEDRDFVICSNSTGEDTECDHGVDLSILDHIYYFDIRIGGFCRFDVNATMTQAQEGGREGGDDGQQLVIQQDQQALLAAEEDAQQVCAFKGSPGVQALLVDLEAYRQRAHGDSEAYGHGSNLHDGREDEEGRT